MSLSRSTSPSLASSSMHAEVMCLLTEAISNAVCWVTGTPCSGTAQPAVAELTSSPAKYTPTAMPGSSSPASELTKAGRPETSRRPRRSRVTSADMTANVSWSAHAGVLGGAAIDDIISYGKDPQRGRWPRLVTVATIVVAVLAVLISEHLPRGTPRHHHPRATASPPPPASLPVRIRPARPDGISGPTAPWAAGLRLPVSGQRPAWLWPATGRIAAIGGLPWAPSDYVFTSGSGGWAVQQGRAAP